MLVQSDATIGGSIHVIGANASNSGAAGDGQLGDDGLPGAGGPGGFAGGRGALKAFRIKPALDSAQGAEEEARRRLTQSNTPAHPGAGAGRCGH